MRESLSEDMSDSLSDWLNLQEIELVYDWLNEYLNP